MLRKNWDKKEWTYKDKKCLKCSNFYFPKSGKQKYYFNCLINSKCIFCNKIVCHPKYLYCNSCKQLGDKNNSKKENVKKKYSKLRKGKKFKSHTKETRQKISETKKKNGKNKGKNNPQYGKVTYGTGRCKWFDYISPIAGNVRLQGTYELRFAKILDSLGWNWKNNKEFFPYCENHSYVLDFKVLMGNKCIYFDTKGWFSEKDQIKIKQVREVCNINLIIVTKQILNAYERMVI